MIVMARTIECRCGRPQVRGTPFCSICNGADDAREWREEHNPEQKPVAESAFGKRKPERRKFRSVTILPLLLLLTGCVNCACSAGVESLVMEERVDVIEVNQVRDQWGRDGLKQVIFWRWSRGDCEVVAWRLWHPTMHLRRERQGFSLTFYDGAKMRCVQADAIQEVLSECDREIQERDWLPVSERKGLRGERK